MVMVMVMVIVFSFAYGYGYTTIRICGYLLLSLLRNGECWCLRTQYSFSLYLLILLAIFLKTFNLLLQKFNVLIRGKWRNLFRLFRSSLLFSS